jgi:Rieske Fe-S protein
MGSCDECRRGLLKVGLAGAAALLVPACGGAQSAPAAGPEDGGENDGAGDDAGEGGACGTTCTTGAKTLELTFAKYPQLEKVGGSVVVRAPGYTDPSCGLDLVIVVQSAAGKYVALSAGCTHACCTVGYNASRTEFLCPCHGSTYDTGGQVTGGPARKALQNLSVCSDACAVYVTYP